MARPVKRLLDTLRERQIFPVLIAYLAISWVIIQATSIVVPAFEFPPWVIRAAVITTVAGFPLAAVFAWFFNFTPQGVARVSRLSSAVGLRAPARGAKPPMDGSAVSIAVLPMDALGASEDVMELADGLATEIHATLGKLHQLRVASRRSAFRFRHSEQPVEEIAADLGVRYVLTGSLMRSGDHLRVIAELDDGQDGHQMWTEKFEAGIEDIFSVQADIAAAVVGAVGMEREKAEIARFKDRPARSLDAWSLVQKARNYINDYSEASLDEASKALKRAIKLDADYASAHATLGSVLIEKVLNGYSKDPAEDRKAALIAAEKAVTLNSNDTYVQKMAGMVFSHCGRLEESLQVLRKCVEQAPFDFGAWGYLGWPLNSRAEPEDLVEVHQIMDRLLETAPNHPGAAFWLYHKSVASCLQGKPEQSEELMARAAEMQNPVPWALMHVANICGMLGKTEEARAALNRAKNLNAKMQPRVFADCVRFMTGGRPSHAKRLEGLEKLGLF